MQAASNAFGLVLIAPILAFDIWLACTTGKREWDQWRTGVKSSRLLWLVGAGLIFALLCAFVIEYHWSDKLRFRGFPVPFCFFALEGNTWTNTSSAGPLPLLARLTDLATGLVAPLIPFKVAEFLRAVKAELK